MRSTKSRFLSIASTLAASATALTWNAFRKDLRAARQRVDTGQFIDTPDGAIEFGECGAGPAALVIHGAGGGFDQGLDLGRAFLGESWRIVAPSRFGYLGTPLPANASPAAQADAHLRLLDALQLDTVPVIGVSAGAPSAMQLCVRHPERCTALILAVPMAWAPNRETVTPSPFFKAMLNAITTSDFAFWTAIKLARASLVRTILGTPLDVYRSATADERRSVDRILQEILPISRRAAGIHNDAIVSATLPRYALEDIQAPALLLSSNDDLYRTYDSALYTAELIPSGEFVGYRTGGHLLLGHEADVRAQITRFLTRTPHLMASSAV